MTTFYPGPSQIYPQIAGYLQEAYLEGILMANHRSKTSIALLEKTVELLHEKLNIPADFKIYFTTSGTECWQIISESIPAKRFLHFNNGGFGEKWYEYSKKLASEECISIPFGINETLPTFEKKTDDIICITQNETSNGTQVKKENFEGLNLDTGLIVVDAVSSMGGIELNWDLADVWLASVQKCFGLPAGLGIMVCSPKVMYVANYFKIEKHYNSLITIDKNMAKFQTTNTPNILAIYLLNKVLKHVPNIKTTSERIKTQAAEWYNFLKKNDHFELLCTNPQTQSDTVIVVKGKPQAIEELKKKTEKDGLILGKGYGIWTENTFRIANFPAIDPKEIIRLRDSISTFKI